MSSVFPDSLLAPLFRIEGGLLRDRYLEALESITGKRAGLERFHVDALGHSPELAALLGDPYYLGHGAIRPGFVIVSPDQLGGPVAHPGAGFAVRPFRRMAADLAAEIASLTLDAPVHGDFRHGAGRLDDAGRLNALDQVGIAPGATGMRLEHARVLARMSRELLDSSTRWCDDAFIEQMLPLAGSARGWSKMIEALEERSYPTGSFFHPALGGSYVFELGGARPRVVLTASTEPSPSEVEGTVRVLLNEDNVVDFLIEEQLAEFDMARHALAPAFLESKLFWIGLDFLMQTEGPERLRGMTPGTVERRTRQHASPPAEFLELEEVRFHLARGGQGLRFGSLTPRTALRLLTPFRGREETAETTAHLLAFLDPLDWSGCFRHAPDLFYARYPAQPEVIREHIVGFVR